MALCSTIVLILYVLMVVLANRVGPNKSTKDPLWNPTKSTNRVAILKIYVHAHGVSIVANAPNSRSPNINPLCHVSAYFLNQGNVFDGPYM